MRSGLCSTGSRKGAEGTTASSRHTTRLRPGTVTQPPHGCSVQRWAQPGLQPVSLWPPSTAVPLPSPRLSRRDRHETILHSPRTLALSLGFSLLSVFLKALEPGPSGWEKRFFPGTDRCSVCGRPALTGLTFTGFALVLLSLLGAWEALLWRGEGGGVGEPWPPRGRARAGCGADRTGESLSAESTLRSVI